MIQFNLLPDIKLEFMRAQRMKRMTITIAVLVSVLSVSILVALCLVVFLFQHKHMNDLSKDISGYTKNLSDTSDVNKILTVQNQLTQLNTLHDKKQDTTRVFPFIEKLTPTNVSISSLTIDFDASTMVITGASNSNDTGNKLAAVNTFVDTLKFTTYKDASTGQSTQAFKDVVLASFGRSDQGASYTINLSFDPLIFATTSQVDLSVPTQITTRSQIDKPSDLFVPSKTTTTTGGQ